MCQGLWPESDLCCPSKSPPGTGTASQCPGAKFARGFLEVLGQEILVSVHMDGDFPRNFRRSFSHGSTSGVGYVVKFPSFSYIVGLWMSWLIFGILG